MVKHVLTQGFNIFPLNVTFLQPEQTNMQLFKILINSPIQLDTIHKLEQPMSLSKLLIQI